jgi:dihydropyrimidinase
MSDFDTVIKGGTIVTASDTFRADVGISKGKIVAIADDLAGGSEVVMATGKLVMPGGIDSHVHISQPSGDGVVMSDDFDSATRSAAFGGNTTVMPFCFQEKGQGLRDALSWYHGLAEGNCHIDVSFHLIVSDPTPQVLGQELPALAEEGYTSFKMFMTYEGLKLTDREILETMMAAKLSGARAMIHAENDDAINFLRDQAEMAGDTAPKFHASTRPIPVEREATHRAISLAEIVDVPLVIVHVSNREAMEEIARARGRGLKIYGETCPQYLVLTAEDLDMPQGAKNVCSPPPRDKASQVACWEGIEQGAFSVFSSDHCPFRFEDTAGKKHPMGERSFRWIPNGIPGVETRLPILFSEGVGKGRIDLQRFVALASTNHAKLYGLYPQKGTIAIGSDADIVLWDPEKQVTITQDILHHGSDYTPYEGMEVIGWPVLTMVRGKTVVSNGKMLSGEAQGMHVSRRKPAA